jgi:hypothetical protein
MQSYKEFLIEVNYTPPGGVENYFGSYDSWVDFQWKKIIFQFSQL